MHNALRTPHFLPWRNHTTCTMVLLMELVPAAGKLPYTMVWVTVITAKIFFP